MLSKSNVAFWEKLNQLDLFNMIESIQRDMVALDVIYNVDEWIEELHERMFSIKSNVYS